MFQEIIIKYFHPSLNLDIQDIKNVWLLTPIPIKLTTAIHQGNLTFRFPVNDKRISYKSKERINKETIDNPRSLSTIAILSNTNHLFRIENK